MRRGRKIGASDGISRMRNGDERAVEWIRIIEELRKERSMDRRV